MKAIGNTPLIKLEKLSEPGCAEICVKYEGSNPTWVGSKKDNKIIPYKEQKAPNGMEGHTE